MKTQRLTLRPPSAADLDHLIQLRTNPKTMQYVGDRCPQTPEQVKQALEKFIHYYEKYGFGFLSVFETNTGQFIGQAGLFHLGFDESQEEIEVAYRLLPEFWGKGYATELALALVHWGFTQLPYQKIIAAVHPENIASQKVLEKAGFVDVGQVDWYSGHEVLGYETHKSDGIEISPYDPHWPKLAAAEIAIIRTALPSDKIVDIQHFGSTSIPNLSAKPLIDILIAVNDLDEIKTEAVKQLEKLKYVFWANNPSKNRLTFIKGMPPYGEKRTHHVHIVEHDSRHWKDKIKFRDYLRQHPEAAQAYQVLKTKLAHEHTYDRELYTENKTAFVKEILEKD